MDLNKQKEEFNIAYVRALAAHAGLNCISLSVDDDSVDIGFKGRGYRGSRIRSPQIELQLKCTGRELIDGDVIKYPLKKKNYEDLRGQDFSAPRYLAVLLVPPEVEKWIGHQEDHISLYNNCYWVSLRDALAIKNKASVTIDVPLNQRLTSHTLRTMIDRASEGEWL
jgi:hypothetical protein